MPRSVRRTTLKTDLSAFCLSKWSCNTTPVLTMVTTFRNNHVASHAIRRVMVDTDGDYVQLRLIARSTAFSSRYAKTVIAMPTSQRSTCRMKGPLGVVFVKALFIIRVSSIEGLRSATSNLLRAAQLILPFIGRNIHYRGYPR